jgi:hypothetical protein
VNEAIARPGFDQRLSRIVEQLDDRLPDQRISVSFLGCHIRHRTASCFDAVGL